MGSVTHGITINTDTGDFPNETATLTASSQGTSIPVEIVGQNFRAGTYYNVQVTLHREGDGYVALRTGTLEFGSDFSATFTNVVGGSVWIAYSISTPIGSGGASGSTANFNH